MEIKKKKKLSVYAVFAIVFGVIGLICFAGNLISFINTVTYYVTYGYTLGDILKDMIYSSVYQILEPVATFGGVSLLLLAFDKVLKKLSDNKCEADVKQSVAADESEDASNISEAITTE